MFTIIKTVYNKQISQIIHSGTKHVSQGVGLGCVGGQFAAMRVATGREHIRPSPSHVAGPNF
jgi:hypothetical protein